MEILAKQEELRNQIRQANDELENLNRLIGKRKQNQQRYCAKVGDLSSAWVTVPRVSMF